MNDLLWHPQTQAAITALIAKPSHALLMVGADGSGKATIASYLTRQLLDINTDADLSAQPNIKLHAGDQAIPIEFIRELRDFVKLRSVGERKIARVILLPNAQRMQVPAQNALLKLLEEPPADTVIIMTAPSERALLPTIVSRTQVVRLQQPGKDHALEYFSSQGHDNVQIERYYLLSNGRTGLLAALLKEDTSHPLAAQVLLAKELLQASAFERLVKVEELSKDKGLCLATLDALEQVTKAALAFAAKSNKLPMLKKLHSTLEQISLAKDSIAANVQTKLALTNLFMHM